MMLMPGCGIGFFISWLMTGKMGNEVFPAWLGWGTAITELGVLTFFIGWAITALLQRGKQN